MSLFYPVWWLYQHPRLLAVVSWLLGVCTTLAYLKWQ